MQEELLHIFPLHLRETLQKVTMKENTLEEIRIRIGQPVIFHMENEEWYLKKETGRLERSQVNAYCATKEDIKSMVKFISSYSLYAYEDEMKRGFITMQGGHRIGVAGQVVMDGGKVLSLSNIYFLNIRVAREKRGCAKDIIPYLIHRNSIYNTLFVSPPGIGKTTYLRDAIRILSNGSDRLHGMKISIIDERSEIAACRQGIPQNDVGIRTDVLDCCSKAEGMVMLLRSMAPQVIAVDEIGNYEDIRAIEMTLNSGCKLLATVHGSSIDEIRKKPLLERLIKEHVFERYIILQKETAGKIGKVREIYDERGTCLYQRQRSVC